MAAASQQVAPFLAPDPVPGLAVGIAGKLRYWKEKDGRFYARIAVPVRLRPFLAGQPSELIEALGGDRRSAIRLHPAAVARLQLQITGAERRAAANRPVTADALFPLSLAQLAASLYAQRLELDDQLRNDPRYASVGLDDHYVQQLRDGMAGKLSDAEFQLLIGSQIERFRLSGNLTAQPGSTEWREIARALCVAEYEALSRVAERDEADFTGAPEHPLLVNAVLPKDEPEPFSLTRLWEDYLAARTKAGFNRDGGKVRSFEFCEASVDFGPEINVQFTCKCHRAGDQKANFLGRKSVGRVQAEERIVFVVIVSAPIR